MSDEQWQVITGDCLEVMRGMDAGSVDAVITDPPYGIDGSKGTINKLRSKGQYSGAFEDTPDYIRAVVIPAVELARKLSGCVILTPGNRNFCFYPQPDSFGAFYQPAAVGMQTFGNLDAQPIFYYGKNATGKNLGKSCSFKMTDRPEKLEHPCVKPLETWKRLLLNHTLPGQLILDPFCGSGTTGVACIQTGRRFIGIEIDPGYADITRARIAKAAEQARQLELPIE